METKRTISVIVIAAILALTTQSALAGISISACFGSSRSTHGGIVHGSSHGRVVHGSSHGRVVHGSSHGRVVRGSIGRSSICSPHISSSIHCYPRIYPYHHKSIVYRSPRFHTRFSWICPPPPSVVVTVPPVVCKPAPVVKVVESNTITVWFTNTNGSKSSVTLTKSGPGFIGPRAEYYKAMPTEEQLRMVYGF